MRDIRPGAPKPKNVLPPDVPPGADLPAQTPSPAPKPVKLAGTSVPVTNVHLPRTSQDMKRGTAPVPRTQTASAPAAQKPIRPLFAPKTVFANKKNLSTRIGHKERSLVFALLVLLLLAGGLAAFMFLPKATIRITLTTAPLLIDQPLVLQANADNTPDAIPGTAFMRQVKVEGDSPVASTEVIGTKTKGDVVIINRTLDEQKIKENSRLVASDGKLFYMLKPAFVPAAESNALASYTVTVEAAEAGEEYNLGKQRLNFAALDKSSQSLVYAEITTPLTGGAGEKVTVVKEADIEAAKQAAKQAARTQAEQEVRKELPNGWTLLDESWQSKVDDFKTDKGIGEKVSQLHYAAQVTVNVMGYEQKSLEAKLRSALEAKLDKDYMLFPGPITYTKSVNSIDWDNSQGKITVRVTHTTIPRISLDALRDKLSGLGADQAKTYLAGLPGVKSASVELWPFWATTIPRIQNRLDIDLKSDRS